MRDVVMLCYVCLTKLWLERLVNENIFEFYTLQLQQLGSGFNLLLLVAVFMGHPIDKCRSILYDYSKEIQK